ncbi:MAG: two-component system response regulator GlrR [Gammaproteobacteria bacterium RIFCSPLOWO2_02_FULL_47_50]|nr:MAG: two-component system response regulator GlrR [Gammaproteobacteria bacterium RIFCSPLOWO2_02_47_7]OGT65271.1 MAG: two-component system response regulator GlrR [Gammaproteobacteria bacterium RIFCSPLOWO2_01_FULL_47_190]OGT74898.1 MAG: two-component system response regulator GlrR [Gammaproteobacteria bacterium RIFCSPLOWO2_12_47_11]OGT78124.1 MAG: two-component system response regulator GlrR [Gammaproteobacteria bacterium RIFCSPLOWO2_02_FULL_47_50]OGT82933.1 MAG: two-component system response
METDTEKKLNSNYRILVVDDDQEILTLLTNWLTREGFNISTAMSGEQALAEITGNSPNLVITDLYMNGMSGMQLLTAIHSDNPLFPVIMLSGQAQIQDAIKATHLGCSAFLTKPIDQTELVSQVRQVLRITKDSKAGDGFARNVLYRSKQMVELLELAETVADSNVTVFISGATGTGKEVIAKAIHEGSSRCNHPFIAVNCGAIPEHLLESELFGHEKGAFTGANTRHEGLFMAANGGTLFLDEIGDMPLNLQVKLLRVLQDLEVRPVGSTKSYPIDVRIISATHKDLEKSVNEGEFRVDLFYRLKVIPLHMPALAERSEDIPLLADYYLQQYANRNNKQLKHFAPAAVEYLMSSIWPGNIRQLINVVDLCATLCKTNVIPLNLVKKALQDRPQQIKTLREVKQECEKNYLVSVLRISTGNVANAAKIAGRNRTEFYKLLGQHDLDPADYR